MLKKVSLFTAALLFICATGPASADDDAKSLVLTGHAKGTAAPTPTADPCILTNLEFGTGLMLNIGRISWVSDEVVDFSPSADCLMPDSAQVKGAFVMTTENSDQIKGVLQTVAEIDSVAATISFLGHFELTGGTGAFEGVTGQGTVSGVGNLLPPFDVKAEFIGDLSPGDD